MAMPFTFWPTITFIALMAALASICTLTTSTFTLPSALASSLAPWASSTKYCWSPCF
jgi:hypothetical protein